MRDLQTNSIKDNEKELVQISSKPHNSYASIVKKKFQRGEANKKKEETIHW